MTEEIEAPEQPVESAPEEQEQSISADSVASTAETPSVPDASIVADRFNAKNEQLESLQKRRQEEAEYKRIRQELDMLQKLRGGDFQQKFDETSEKIKDSDNADGALMKKLQKRLDDIAQRQERWEQQIQAQQEQAEIATAQNQVAAWVKENAEHFPLINAIGQQPIVFQKMYNSRGPDGRMMSEAAAAREVEAELQAIVERCAPELGYTKGQVSQQGEDQVSINSAMNIAEPYDRDKISEEQRLEILLRQAQGL